MKSQVLRHLGRTSGHAVAGAVTAGTAALPVVVNTASTAELPDEPMAELSTELYESPIELPTGTEVITAEDRVEVASTADEGSPPAAGVVNGAEPVPTGPVAETQPTGIMHDSPVQSLAIVQAPAGAVTELVAVTVPDTAEVIGQPTGIMQASPIQSLAMVQVPDGTVTAEEMTAVASTSPI